MINNKIDLVTLIRTAGRNIQTLRINKKLSIEVLAEEIDISAEELENIESGQVNDLSFSKVVIIANYFNISLQELLDLQIVQIFNNSQNITAGDREVSYTNHLKDGYEVYINHLKEENLELRKKVEDIS